MSQETNQLSNLGEELVEALFPKVLANHISKREEFADLRYKDVLDMCSNEGETINDRIATIAQVAGRSSLADELVHEVGILQLTALGREKEVEDANRQLSYQKSDRNQIKDASSDKSLDYYLVNGIEIIFSPEDREKASRHCKLDDRQVPLIEKLKAQRILGINGFNDSRVMYAVHDMVDHAWLFRSLRERGIMDKYSDFLDSIDMGQSAFLYSRQAELLASVGFGSRRWEVALNQGEELLLDEQSIKKVLLSRDDPRTVEAATLLDTMNPTERKQAVFMIENMAVQFADERRRWGSVKIHEGNGQRNRPIDLFDPLHLAIMLESLSSLQGSKQFQAAQFAATIGVEHMLESALDDKSSDSRITIPVPKPDDRPININEDKPDWIKRHLSVSTSYNRID